jgi:hypothetical protein
LNKGQKSAIRLNPDAIPTCNARRRVINQLRYSLGKYKCKDCVMVGVICLVSGNNFCPHKFLYVVTQKIGVEVNADKTKYMVISRDQNAGRSNSMYIDNTG